jgi:hypothetical protein
VPEQGDASRVSSKRLDVFLDPLLRQTQRKESNDVVRTWLQKMLPEMALQTIESTNLEREALILQPKVSGAAIRGCIPQGLRGKESERVQPVATEQGGNGVKIG